MFNEGSLVFDILNNIILNKILNRIVTDFLVFLIGMGYNVTTSELGRKDIHTMY